MFAEMQMRGAQKLIVDLRGNEGGNDCGDPILARLINAPLKRADYARRVRYQRVPERLNAYLDTWDDSFRDWGNNATARTDGFFDLQGETEDAGIQPKGPRFTGKVIVLIDAENSSATFQFAQTVQQNGLGTLVGQATGGNLRGINGGSFFFLRLPASGLEVDVPLVASFPKTTQPDSGVTPDTFVALTSQDIGRGEDPVLSAALQA
jgi:C-terminal processing protease CtpA/Prc